MVVRGKGQSGGGGRRRSVSPPAARGHGHEGDGEESSGAGSGRAHDALVDVATVGPIPRVMLRNCGVLYAACLEAVVLGHLPRALHCLRLLTVGIVGGEAVGGANYCAQSVVLYATMRKERKRKTDADIPVVGPDPDGDGGERASTLCHLLMRRASWLVWAQRECSGPRLIGK